jgi:formylglycine-generating enzyme required for sulfatase activity
MGPAGSTTVPVTLAGFEMLATEVTAAQYRSCIAAGACPSPANQNCEERWHADLPVGCVDGIEADAFCRWIGGRLPSGAEWEYALRNAGQDLEFPWGNAAPQCDRAILWDRAVSPEPGCGRYEPWPGCSRSADISEQGICDLVGNVTEWIVAGSGAVASRLPTRGASYLSSYLHFTLRQPGPPASPDESGISIGFRCVR